MSDQKNLRELIEDAVDKGASTVEDIHRSIADLPITILERVGLFENTTDEVRRLQDASIGAIYELIRDVNRSVSELAGELLDERLAETKGGAKSEGAAPNATA